MTVKRLFFLCVCVLSSLLVSAQGRYSTRLLENGTMLFFNPCKLVAMQKETSLVYDMTYLTHSDSVTVNMTYTALTSDVREVRIVSGTASYGTANYSIFYREKDKKRIATRIHISCPKNTYEDLSFRTLPCVSRLFPRRVTSGASPIKTPNGQKRRRAYLRPLHW